MQSASHLGFRCSRLPTAYRLLPTDRSRIDACDRGQRKGRPLKAPAGMGTRPMTDRVKDSLFNILTVMGYPQEGDRVLDLYAGTGALGIEALSRGAAWADFVEQANTPARCIAANLAATGLAGRGKIHQLR